MLTSIDRWETDKDLKFLQWADVGAEIFRRCLKRAYMSIVVGPTGRVVGTGRNGSPPGMPNCTDGYCPRFWDDSPSGSIYSNCIANHSEVNALLFSDLTARAGGTLYVNGQPCWDCGKTLAGSNLARVVFYQDLSYSDGERVNDFMRQAGLVVIPVERKTDEGQEQTIELDVLDQYEAVHGSEAGKSFQ